MQTLENVCENLPDLWKSTAFLVLLNMHMYFSVLMLSFEESREQTLKIEDIGWSNNG